MMATMSARELASKIQHTLANTPVRRNQIEAHIAQCVKYGFHAAMIPPFAVQDARSLLEGEAIRLASWVDFPLGVGSARAKQDLTRVLVDAGVDEIDLMPNVGLLLDGEVREYERQIRRVVHVAQGVPIKVMLELPLLADQEARAAVRASIEAGAKYLKNASSGSVGEATVDQIRFLKELAPEGVSVKASGGIGTYTQALKLLEAGADLIGTSRGEEIMRETNADSDGPESAMVESRVDNDSGERY